MSTSQTKQTQKDQNTISGSAIRLSDSASSETPDKETKPSPTVTKVNLEDIRKMFSKLFSMINYPKQSGYTKFIYPACALNSYLQVIDNLPVDPDKEVFYSTAYNDIYTNLDKLMQIYILDATDEDIRKFSETLSVVLKSVRDVYVTISPECLVNKLTLPDINI